MGTASSGMETFIEAVNDQDCFKRTSNFFDVFEKDALVHMIRKTCWLFHIHQMSMKKM